jgi:seryl-tRNA synthetase
VHQFTKVEMFCFSLPEQSDSLLLEILSIEEEIHTALGIPYRVIEIPASDLGAQAARKFDLEAWMPGRDEWGEITSASNTTDFQSRNLNIRYKAPTGSAFVHTLNGTALALSRTPVALFENFQREDGGVDIPAALHPYLPFTSIEPKTL